MKHSATLAPAARQAEPAPADFTTTTRYFSGWTDFWFTAVDPIALCRLRFLSGLLFFFWLLPFAGHVQEFFGNSGWFDQTAAQEASELNVLPGGPFFGRWLMNSIGDNHALLTSVYWGALCVFLLFALGVGVRITALLSWFFVISFLPRPAAGYDADHLVALIAFYMLLGHLLLSQWRPDISPLERIIGPKDIGLLACLRGKPASDNPVPSHGANFAMRLLQVHFAIVVVTSGLHKLQSGDWWSGWALFYPLHAPFETTEESIRAEAAAGTMDLHYFLLSLVQYLVLAWQLGFPLFAWRKRWRVVLLGGAVVGWLGCIFLYRLPLFGPIYLLGCLSYITPEEWLGVNRLTRRLLGSRAAPVVKEVRFQPRVR